VQVRNENVVNLVVVEFGASELELGALAAIDQEQLVPYVQHLGCRQMATGRQCRPATQYV